MTLFKSPKSEGGDDSGLLVLLGLGALALFGLRGVQPSDGGGGGGGGAAPPLAPPAPVPVIPNPLRAGQYGYDPMSGGSYIGTQSPIGVRRTYLTDTKGVQRPGV